MTGETRSSASSAFVAFCPTISAVTDTLASAASAVLSAAKRSIGTSGPVAAVSAAAASEREHDDRPRPSAEATPKLGSQSQPGETHKTRLDLRRAGCDRAGIWGHGVGTDPLGSRAHITAGLPNAPALAQ